MSSHSQDTGQMWIHNPENINNSRKAISEQFMIPFLILITSIFFMAVFAAFVRPKFNELIIVTCTLASGIIGWYFLSIRTEEIFIWLFPPEPFASVEWIMKEANYEYLLIHTCQSFGWAIGLLYFWVVFGIFYLLKTQLKKSSS